MVNPSTHQTIRKQLESVLRTAMLNAGVVVPNSNPLIPAIEWPNLSFDRDKVKSFVRFSYNPGGVTAPEIGSNSRIEATGFIKTDCFVLTGGGSDAVDLLTGPIEQAFPYPAAFQRNGITIKITGPPEVGVGQPAPQGGWWYVPVTIPWLVERL